MASVTAMSVRIAPLSTAGTSRGTPGRRARISPHTRTGKIARPVPPTLRAVDDGGFGAGVATAGTDNANALDDHVPIDRFYTGLRQLHASPDVFIVDDFITPNQCDSIVAAAKTRAMDQSPVVYAGWTNDVSEVVNIAARGPALWIAALSMLAAASSNGAGPGVLINGAVAYALIVGVAAAGAGTYVKYKESQLQGMRTSTSCALDGASDGERAYVAAAEALMPGSVCEKFEAPTVIRYQPGQAGAALRREQGRGRGGREQGRADPRDAAAVPQRRQDRRRGDTVRAAEPERGAEKRAVSRVFPGHRGRRL